MKGLWKIAKWEITRNLTNKQFIIGLLLTPVLMGLFAGVPILLDRLNQPSLSTYYVVDHLGELASLQALLPENIALKEHQDSGSIADVVRDTNSSGYFTLDQSFITTGQIDVAYNDRSMETLSTVKGSLTALLQQIRLAHSDISLEQLAFVNAPAQVREVALDEELEPKTNDAHDCSYGFHCFGLFPDPYLRDDAHAERLAGEERPHGRGCIVIGSFGSAHAG